MQGRLTKYGVNNQLISNAADIAYRDLQRCYREYGIIAGLNHFNDYWARDSFFASCGSLVMGDFDIVRKNLETFIKFQKSSGHIPRRIDRMWGTILLKYAIR